MKTIISTIIAMAVASPALLADLSVGATSTTPQMPTQVQGNCDLLASNAVRATYLGQRTLFSQTLDQDAPVSVQVAVFRVIDNIAHRRYVRYGDGPLTAGKLVAVELSYNLPGQPASVASDIALMQPGEEAVLKIDHLYVFGNQPGKDLRPCTRLARAQAAASAAPQPAQPQQPTLPGSASLPAAPRQPVLPAGSDGDDTIIEQRPITPAPVNPQPATKGGSRLSEEDSF